MSITTQKMLCFSCIAVVLCFIFGCGAPEKKYIPAADSARDALDAALETWKSGAAHATIEDFRVPINFIDMRWQSGKKLESYEILSEEKFEGTARRFLVKMKLDEDKEENEVKYYIVGIDPFHIYREQDYNKASGL